jgi:hypothetical protein
MSTIQLTDKFIAYIDILGYSALTRAAEAGIGFSFAEMEEILEMLGTEEDRKHHQKYGPTTCPQAPRMRNDLDFQIAQVWDSVVVSAEVSPAGVVNLISHCFGVCIHLLTKGVMCRGYVKRGKIYHDGQKIFGSGHVEAVAKEKNVSFFKQNADERGTPFIEVDAEVVDFVAKQPDKCVKEMFGRMVLSHEGLTAVFPIKRLSHSFIIGGFGAPPFDSAKEKMSNDNLRESLKSLKQKVMTFVDQSDSHIVGKANHYVRALDEQMKVCDRTDEMIDALCRPIGRRMTKEEFPGLFS